MLNQIITTRPQKPIMFYINFGLQMRYPTEQNMIPSSKAVLCEADRLFSVIETSALILPNDRVKGLTKHQRKLGIKINGAN